MQSHMAARRLAVDHDQDRPRVVAEKVSDGPICGDAVRATLATKDARATATRALYSDQSPTPILMTVGGRGAAFGRSRRPVAMLTAFNATPRELAAMFRTLAKTLDAIA